MSTSARPSRSRRWPLHDLASFYATNRCPPLLSAVSSHPFACVDLQFLARLCACTSLHLIAGARSLALPAPPPWSLFTCHIPASGSRVAGDHQHSSPIVPLQSAQPKNLPTLEPPPPASQSRASWSSSLRILPPSHILRPIPKNKASCRGNILWPYHRIQNYPAISGSRTLSAGVEWHAWMSPLLPPPSSLLPPPSTLNRKARQECRGTQECRPSCRQRTRSHSSRQSLSDPFRSSTAWYVNTHPDVTAVLHTVQGYLTHKKTPTLL